MRATRIALCPGPHVGALRTARVSAVIVAGKFDAHQPFAIGRVGRQGVGVVFEREIQVSHVVIAFTDHRVIGH